MVILQTKGEKEINNTIKWILRKKGIEIIKTGLDPEMLSLLISIYLAPEFHNNKREEVKNNES